MEKMLPTFRVFGRKVRAHDKDCAQSFREDRQAGLIYSAIRVTPENEIVSWERGSVLCDFCVYCGSK